jgi:protein dithiol:quinone oxidoreductase
MMLRLSGAAMTNTRSSGVTPYVLGAALLVCIAALAVAYYLQHVLLLEPCPWCIAQRILFMIVGLFALAALVHRRWRRVYSSLGAFFAVAGIVAAAYHLRLQGRPESSVCMGGWLEKLLDASQLGKLWPAMFQYDGPCVLAPWEMLGLTIPEWSLACFVALSAAMIGRAMVR